MNVSCYVLVVMFLLSGMLRDSVSGRRVVGKSTRGLNEKFHRRLATTERQHTISDYGRHQWSISSPGGIVLLTVGLIVKMSLWLCICCACRRSPRINSGRPLIRSNSRTTLGPSAIARASDAEKSSVPYGRLKESNETKEKTRPPSPPSYSAAAKPSTVSHVSLDSEIKEEGQFPTSSYAVTDLPNVSCVRLGENSHYGENRQLPPSHQYSSQSRERMNILRLYTNVALKVDREEENSQV